MSPAVGRRIIARLCVVAVGVFAFRWLGASPALAVIAAIAISYQAVPEPAGAA